MSIPKFLGRVGLGLLDIGLGQEIWTRVHLWCNSDWMLRVECEDNLPSPRISSANAHQLAGNNTQLTGRMEHVHYVSRRQQTRPHLLILNSTHRPHKNQQEYS